MPLGSEYQSPRASAVWVSVVCDKKPLTRTLPQLHDSYSPSSWHLSLSHTGWTGGSFWSVSPKGTIAPSSAASQLQVLKRWPPLTTQRQASNVNKAHYKWQQPLVRPRGSENEFLPPLPGSLGGIKAGTDILMNLPVPARVYQGSRAGQLPPVKSSLVYASLEGQSPKFADLSFSLSVPRRQKRKCHKDNHADTLLSSDFSP